MKLKQMFLCFTLLTSIGATSAQTLPALTPIHAFAFSNGRHFNTLNHQEGINAGFASVGIAWRSTENAGNLTTLLYRCVVPNHGGQDHFVSLDPNCEGQLREGDFGFAFKEPRSDLVPLYRWYAHPNGFGENDHWINQASWGLPPSYRLEGILGYVYR